MKMKIFAYTSTITKSVMVLVFMSLIQSCGSDIADNANSNAANNNSVTNNDSRYSVNLSTNSGAGNENTSTAANPSDLVLHNIGEAMDEWAPEHDEYTSVTQLKYIWVKTGRRPEDYIPKGASQLITQIKYNDYFKGCPQVNRLKPERFGPGGEIQSIGNLYDELYYCDASNRKGSE